MSSLPPRLGNYGFDAPYAPLLMALSGACDVFLGNAQRGWFLPGTGDAVTQRNRAPIVAHHQSKRP